MNYLKKTLMNTFEFLGKTQSYFRDVLLMHGFLLFIVIPLLSSSTKFILARGGIPYLSYDNLLSIATQHSFVFLLLLLTLLFILLTVYFEFTFLLLSVYFLEKKEAVSLRQLLRMTVIQIRKVRPSVVLFFLFYFLLVLPIGGLNFNSDLLSRIKIPAFIMDFIFANRILIISAFLLVYLALIYLGIRLIFALPEMILRDRPFWPAVKESWWITQRRFFAILGRFLFIGASVLAIASLGTLLVLGAQNLIEAYLPDYALYSAVFAMTLLQFLYLLNIVLSTVGIFFIIVDFMEDEGFLPDIPSWFYKEPLKMPRFPQGKNALSLLTTLFFGIGVSLYNLNYLTSTTETIPLTISHRGVSDKNGVQNSLAALKDTHDRYQPDYVETDVQMTSDEQFVVIHDFDLKALTGERGTPEQMTAADILKRQVKENQQTTPIVSFDEYLAYAQELHQKLLVEIKTQRKDSKELVQRFLDRYEADLSQNQDMIQSLSYTVVEEVKKAAPNIPTGYILPFNLVGPPQTNADFLTMEFSTINRNFITSAKADGKKVFVWTPNSEDDISRMIFYGVDGIITDSLRTLDRTIAAQKDDPTYADKLLNFVIGIG